MQKNGFFSAALLFFCVFYASADTIKRSATQDIALQATQRVESNWGTGYTAYITITNNTNSSISSWNVNFSINQNQTIQSVWSAKLISAQSAQNVSVTNESWNGALAPQQSVSFGYQVNNPQNGITSAVGLTAIGNASSSSQPPTSSLSATYAIDSQWSTGYQITVTLKNNSSTPTSSWQATFNLNQGQSISNMWNATYAASGISITVNNPQWSNGGVIAANGTATFGMVISRPISGAVSINNLQSTANGTSPAPAPTPAPIPQAPVLNAITANQSTPNNYSVSWNAVTNATSYTLQQSSSNSFSNPIVIAQGNILSQSFTNQANGTYYYRVLASNSSGASAWSNTQSVTINVQPSPTPTPQTAPIIDGYWESWNSKDSISSIVNMHADVINISFGTFTSLGNHTFQVSGVESSQATIQQLVSLAHSLNKKVKISIGGASYPMAGMLQTTQDAVGMAQAVAQYVQANNLDGVDIDIEDHTAASLQIALFQNLRQAMPNALITYAPETPASTSQPWADIIKGAYQYVDYMSLQDYNNYSGYNYQADIATIMSWGVPASKIVVGMLPGTDDTGLQTSLDKVKAISQWVLQNGFKGVMFWDLNRDYENLTGLGASAATNAAWSVFHP